MKRIPLLIACAMLAAACTDTIDEVLEQPQHSATTRAVTAETSPYFNWEDTTNISLVNVNGSVVLPWYSTATANIPSFILTDYKAADGWKMVYNTCSPSSVVQDDKYYLIFYNIFSGKLRGFVYNKNDVTAGSTTYWQFTFDNGTSLLNDIDNITLPGNEITTNREMMVTGLANTETKSLNRGWNAFEADFLVYDPTIADKNITMSISAYDVTSQNVSITGDVDLSSNGTMVTTTNISNLQNSGTSNKGVSLLGGKAEEKFNKIFDGKQDATRGLLGSVVGSIVKAGGNFLVKKFFGRNSTQTITSNSDIKIQTTGAITLEGNITSQQQSNVSPISRLMLPGSNPTPQDVFLPSYNEPLGVWSLTSAPVVTATSYDWMYPILNYTSDINALGLGINTNEMTGVMGRRTVYKLTNCSVQINPAIQDCIEKSTTEIKLVYEEKTEGREPTYTMPVPHSAVGETYNTIVYTNKFVSKQDSLCVLSSNTGYGSLAGQYIDPNARLVTMPRKEAGPYISTGVKRSTTAFDNWAHNIYVRVSVTLYPKAPYDTTPIITTRTFKPTFVEGN